MRALGLVEPDSPGTASAIRMLTALTHSDSSSLQAEALAAQEATLAGVAAGEARIEADELTRVRVLRGAAARPPRRRQPTARPWTRATRLAHGHCDCPRCTTR